MSIIYDKFSCRFKSSSYSPYAAAAAIGILVPYIFYSFRTAPLLITVGSDLSSNYLSLMFHRLMGRPSGVDEEFRNGPLRPNTAYKFAEVLHVSKDLFTVSSDWVYATTLPPKNNLIR